MGKFSVLLCDAQEVYVKRLAAGLKRLFQEQVQVSCCSSMEELGADFEVDLLLSSQIPPSGWLEKREHCTCLWLDDREDVAEGFPWKDCVYKYQSVAKIGKVLQSYLPQCWQGGHLGQGVKRQLWYGVVSAVRHEQMLPFACCLASEISTTGKVLVVVLQEFSGLQQYLELGEGSQMEAFLYQLRKKEAWWQVPLPQVSVLPSFDLMLGPENPMVLYELNDQDIQRLMECIRNHRQYDAVVWVAGNMMPGMEQLFLRSQQVYSIEKQDCYSRCCQQEFDAFYRKLIPTETVPLVKVSLPAMLDGQTGQHLLWQWEHSGVGEVVRSLWKGDLWHEDMDAGASQADFRAVKHEGRVIG